MLFINFVERLHSAEGFSTWVTLQLAHSLYHLFSWHSANDLVIPRTRTHTHTLSIYPRRWGICQWGCSLSANWQTLNLPNVTKTWHIGTWTDTQTHICLAWLQPKCDLRHVKHTHPHAHTHKHTRTHTCLPRKSKQRVDTQGGTGVTSKATNATPERQEPVCRTLWSAHEFIPATSPSLSPSLFHIPCLSIHTLVSLYTHIYSQTCSHKICKRTAHTKLFTLA